MSKDQLLGILILVGSLVVLTVYGYMIYMPELRMLALIIIATVAVVGVMGIIAWIGWTMATTPPPAPIESFEETKVEEPTTQPDETKPQSEEGK